MTQRRLIDVDITDRADGKVPVWDSGSGTHVYDDPATGGGGFNDEETIQSGDVAMTNANTFYDGPSKSLGAGTWLVMAKITVSPPATTQNYQFTAKLWDGTNVFDETEVDVPNGTTSGTWSFTMVCMAVVTLGTTTTVKISACCTRAGGSITDDVAANGAASHKASRIVAIQAA